MKESRKQRSIRKHTQRKRWKGFLLRFPDGSTMECNNPWTYKPQIDKDFMEKVLGYPIKDARITNHIGDSINIEIVPETPIEEIDIKLTYKP